MVEPPPMPASSSAGLSPFALAMQRFRRSWTGRAALHLLIGVVLIGLYAPFVVGDAALWWSDETGWHLPVFSALVDVWSFPRWVDVIFNITALALPVLVVLSLALRRLRTGTRWLILGGLWLAAVLSTFLPLVPPATADGPWRSLWRRYPPTNMAWSDYQDRLQAVRDYDPASGEQRPTLPRALFPLVPRRHDATPAGAVLKPPLTVLDDESRLWLGGDTGGKDVLARMVHGVRTAMVIGILATALSILIGVIIGALAGYFGGVIDLLLSRLIEIMMCFPTFILILVVVAMVGRDIAVITLVIGFTGWAGAARLVRGEYLAQSVRDYVAAVRVLGLPAWRILFVHILPNVLTPLLVLATFAIAGAVLAESVLGFLGLSDPIAASWGSLLEQGRMSIQSWWLIYVPGLAIFMLVAALNLVGNALREAFDPKASS